MAGSSTSFGCLGRRAIIYMPKFQIQELTTDLFDQILSGVFDDDILEGKTIARFFKQRACLQGVERTQCLAGDGVCSKLPRKIGAVLASRSIASQNQQLALQRERRVNC